MSGPYTFNDRFRPTQWSDGLGLQSAFGWGGWLLLLICLVIVYRRWGNRWEGRVRWMALGLGILTLLSFPVLIDGPAYIYDIAAHRSTPPLLLLPPGLKLLAEAGFRIYEALFVILTTTLGTILYRKTLGGDFDPNL